jgi:hypothetical protein
MKAKIQPLAFTTIGGNSRMISMSMNLLSQENIMFKAITAVLAFLLFYSLLAVNFGVHSYQNYVAGHLLDAAIQAIMVYFVYYYAKMTVIFALITVAAGNVLGVDGITAACLKLKARFE